MSQPGSWSHVVALPCGATSASHARSFVSRHLVDHDLPDLVDDIRLVASELATNAVTHAQTPFTLVLQGDQQSVLLIVRDESDSVPCAAVARPDDTNGRGLAIVESVCRGWGVSDSADGAKSVWAWFTLE